MRSFASHHDIDGTYYVGSWSEQGDEHLEVLPAFEAEAVVRAWAACPFGRDGLRQALLELDAAGAGARGLLDRARELLADGHLRVLRGPPLARGVGAAPAESAAKPAEAPSEIVHWIQVTVVDDEDRPVPNVAIELVLPDESVIRTQTSPFGVVHLPSVPAGKCSLSLPDLDGKAWARVG
jgi:hypothetical protein